MRTYRTSYLVGLDGLRGVAVIAVLLYHAGLLPGGFLGVEVFFVISGYLITLLLLDEWQRRHAIDVVAFWMRRARRLLPASLTLIVVTLAYVAIFLPAELAATRPAALAGMLSLSNWYSVFAQQSYFESIGRPPLLRHLWSLGIEAQFYLLWPLVLLVGLRATSRTLAAATALAFAVGSAVLMAALFDPGTDPSRLYYATDTRASGLLLGCSLALWQSALPPRAGLRRPFILDFVGLAPLGGLGVIAVRVSEFDPLLYRGGFLLVGALSAMTIAIVVDERSFLGRRLLGWRPLEWVGSRSFGIYLWHWPVLTLTRPQLDVPLDRWPLLPMQLAAVCALAELSHRYIETPIRRRELRLRPTRRLGLGVVGALSGLVALGASVAAATPPPRPAYLPVDAIDTWAASQTDDPPQPIADLDARVPLPEGLPAPTPVYVTSVKPRLRVTAIGDSVMLGAASALQDAIDGVEIDAAISRQASACIELLRARATSGELGDVVIVHVGNNGTLSAAQLDELMHVLSGVQRVVVVTVKVPRSWEAPNNAVLRDGAPRYPNAVLVDWQAASRRDPDLFWDDGIHLRPAGAALYATLIAAQTDP